MKLLTGFSKIAPASLLFVNLCGCSAMTSLQGGPSYLPLSEGAKWTYAVTTTFRTPVTDLKVGPKTTVGNTSGRVLSSPLGESRLAWDGPKLIVSQLANCRFNPPITLFREDKIPEKKKQRSQEFVDVDEWKGRLESFDVSRPATGALSMRQSKLTIRKKEVSTVETKVLIKTEKGEMEIRTWFERGVGIVKQEQRTNRNLLVSMELLRSK